MTGIEVVEWLLDSDFSETLEEWESVSEDEEQEGEQERGEQEEQGKEKGI
jgi:hypothetical protein